MCVCVSAVALGIGAVAASTVATDCVELEGALSTPWAAHQILLLLLQLTLFRQKALSREPKGKAYYKQNILCPLLPKSWKQMLT